MVKNDIASADIIKTIQSWLDWQQRERDVEGLPTDDDTAVMSVPVWPSRRQLKNWIAHLSNGGIDMIGRGIIMIEGTDRTSGHDDLVFDARINDAAQLKSGGPNMIVAYVEGDQVKCMWFDDDARLQQSNFHRGALNLFRWHG